MRRRPDGVQKKCLLTSVFIVAVFLVFRYACSGSEDFGESALEYGSRSLRKFGSSYLGGDEDSDLGGKQYGYSVKFGLDDAEDAMTPKNFSVPIKWPKDRDKVWKAIIPHTHVAHEKSDQNWMVVKGDKINFPGAGTHLRHKCNYLERAPATDPIFCRSDDDPDAVWGVQMETCITQYSDHDHNARDSELAPWPARLSSPPPRLADFGCMKMVPIRLRLYTR